MTDSIAPSSAPSVQTDTNAHVQKVAKKAVKSTAITYMAYVLTKLANLITTIILARQLTPTEFGIVGFAITAMSFLDAIRDLGLELALIQRRDDIEEAAHTAFWMNLASNLIIWTLTLLMTPLVAMFFNEPLIHLILPILSLSFIISSFGSTHDALLKREMSFGRRIIPSLGESISKSLVSIGLALGGLSVWALVYGQLAGRATFSALSWVVNAWRPRLRFHRKIAGQLFRYGYKASIDSFISALQANIDYVFIGRFLGDSALGLYTAAYRMPEILVINFAIVIAQVLFPAYAMLQDDEAQLRRGILSALRYVSLVTVPAGVGLALVSQVFFGTFFDQNWAAAAPIMAILALYGAVLAVSWNIGDVYKAIGRPDILWKTALVEFALLAPTLYLLAQQSAFAVAIGHLIVAVIVSLMRLAIASNILKFSLVDALRQFTPSVLGSSVMALVVIGVLALSAGWSGFITLIAAIVAGGLSYLGVMWFAEREMFENVLDIALRIVRRGKQSAKTAE